MVKQDAQLNVLDIVWLRVGFPFHERHKNCYTILLMGIHMLCICKLSFFVFFGTLLYSTTSLSSVVDINFDDLPAGTDLTSQYSKLGVIFSAATIYNPGSISAPPLGNITNFVLPSSGFNSNGSFSIAFSDPITFDPIVTPYITFSAYLARIGDTSDAFDITYQTGGFSSVGPVRYRFDSNKTFTITDPAGIQSITFQDWGVNAFDNFQFNLVVSTVPAPPSIFLYMTGLLTVAYRFLFSPAAIGARGRNEVRI